MGDDDWDPIPYTWFEPYYVPAFEITTGGPSTGIDFGVERKESEANNNMEEKDGNNEGTIEEQSLDTLRRELEGKEILLKTAEEMSIGSYDGSNYVDNIYFNEEMYEHLGSVWTIETVLLAREEGQKVFRLRDSRWVYPVQAIAGIIVQDIRPKGTTTERDSAQEVSAGDIVKVVGLIDIPQGSRGDRLQCEETGRTKWGIPLMTLNLARETAVVRKLKNKWEIEQGTELLVRDIKDGVIIPYYLDGKYRNDVIKVDDVEIAEKGYLDRIKAKQRKKKEEKEIIADLEIIEEMISKVNIKDFKKVYAGAIGKTPNDILGIDLLLNQWAFNKKHLYLMLGREFGISKEIESEKDHTAMKEDKQKLMSMFPGITYVMENIDTGDFGKNRLSDEVYAPWMERIGKSSYYQEGTKVSKILNEAFDNEKLNIAYSDIIAENKMRGIIEISIDPLEILLMSTNASGWDSCHKISTGGSSRSWGGYSGGIFSYMCDNVSMIAFRHSQNKVTMKFWKNNVEINSKNWRQMIWISPSMDEFITSRQYPAKSDDTTKNVRELLEAVIDDYKKEDTTWVHSADQSKLRGRIADYNPHNGIKLNTMHYNDMIHGYEGDLCYTKGKNMRVGEIVVGSNPICPKCGKMIMNRSSNPMCDDCRRDL